MGSDSIFLRGDIAKSDLTENIESDPFFRGKTKRGSPHNIHDE